MEISLEGLNIYARHGVMEQERKVGNRFVVDISLSYPPALEAARTDTLDSTINYAELAAIIKETMETPSFLLEMWRYASAKLLCHAGLRRAREKSPCASRLPLSVDSGLMVAHPSLFPGNGQSLLRNCQKATADAAATLSESTPWAIGMRAT